MSTFSGLDIARRALTVSQKAIDVIGHNIANASTVGYSRQRLSTVSIEPAAGISRLSNAGNLLTGGGVEIVTVDQIRNPFLDRQFRKENTLGSEWGTRSEGLAYVESLFDELSETGLSQSLAAFSNSLQELSKSPASPENRTNALQNALKLTETLHHYSTQLADKQAELDQTITVQTTQINTMAETIADLNSRIALYEISGQKANDLRDQRSNLLDELSGLVAYTYDENPEGQLRVMIGDQALVDHVTVRQLANALTMDNPLNGQADSLNSVIWADNGTAADISGGSLKAGIDLRDGATAEVAGLPYMSRQLDRLAVAMADSFNAIHAAGWTLPDAAAGLASTSGLAFFTAAPDGAGNPTILSAATITVNPDIQDNPNLIAASSETITTASLNGNNQNALAMLKVFTRQDLPDIGSLSGFFNGFISIVAIETSQAEKRADAQGVLSASLQEQRQSVSGVSLDEETTSLIQYQHSYAAAARMITAIDENLDVLINKTGLVGR